MRVVAALAVAMAVSQPAWALGKKRTGTPTTGQPPSLAPAPAHGQFDLRVLSYNVHGVQQPGLDQTRHREIGIWLRHLREQGKGPMIVGIQEAFHERTYDLVQESQYPYVHFGPQLKFPRAGSGVVILSEFPIYDGDDQAYHTCFGVDCLARKGIVRARIAVPGLPVTLQMLDTHLNASYSGAQPPSEKQGELVRISQINQARDFYWSGFDSSALTFFTGDFNTDPGEYAYHNLEKVMGLTNAAQWCGLHGTCAGIANPLDEWSDDIDHQWFSANQAKAADGGPVTIEPILFNREDLGADQGRPLSDHKTHEVTYRIRW
jgi:endonuclease/exonuclease/phosphatase family metal-dependent hydrolase